ncbi:putative fungal-specific transcription protein [Phialemonium atrogriseum]|uniref:Fungal-specific transcription protein n=1 Tax=Phialemonium atrogriseum TaxID=1093897 RepID=A0AAJ0C1Z6_9PEZI|nr:putative fungal-specific transcription protein [Phialemonium atrogriseum]KAK1768430.1 putative fungal-specific transcription protein [Phialemonium atrogriseum]
MATPTASSSHHQQQQHFQQQHQYNHQQTDPGTAGDGGDGDPKKARACESCRGLKVRCVPDPADPEGACRRCAKAGRACVVTQPTRKRQKKTDSRVAELERKIDALTASLQASRGGAAAAAAAAAAGSDGHVGAVAAAGAAAGSLAARGWAAQAPGGERTLQAQLRTAQGGSQHQSAFVGRTADSQNNQNNNSGSGGGNSPVKNKIYPPPMVMAGQKRKFTESRDSAAENAREAHPATPQSQNNPGHDYLDVVDRGVLTMDRAAELFIRYTDQMVSHLPGVVFPAGTTAAEVRKSTPTLFHAIMAASSSEFPLIQRRMVKELMEIFAEKVIVRGEKSLELVQALHVAVIWYWPPEHFEELKFYQLVHISAVMALDIGLGRKLGNPGGFRKYIQSSAYNHQHVRKPRSPDPTSIECRRAWLVCYFLATNTSMAMHRPNLVRWSSFMAECMDVLESSPDAAPTDKYLCHLVWCHKLAEDVGIQFSMDDPSTAVSIADARTQYALRAFERELDRYRKSIPDDMLLPTLKMSFHVISLYMHETATQIDTGEECRHPTTADDLRDALASDAPLTPAHVAALSACLTAIDGIFEVFLAMDVASIRCLPVFNFIRIAYAFVVLIKIYFAASSPKSELGKVIDKDHMKVEQHLENLLDKFRATAADDKSRPATKLLIVLAMLRSWFQKQNPKAPTAAAATSSDAPPTPGCPAAAAAPETARYDPRNGREQLQQQQQQQQQQQPEYPTANTPLQLLSEIATSDSASAPPQQQLTGGGGGGGGEFPWLNRLQPAAQQQQQPFVYGGGGPGPATTSDGTPTSLDPSGGGPIPWLGSGGPGPGTLAADFEYVGLGDGFARAMDLTLAGLADGGFGFGLGLGGPGGGYETGMRYVLQDPPYLDGMGGGGGEGGGAGGFGYQF